MSYYTKEFKFLDPEGIPKTAISKGHYSYNGYTAFWFEIINSTDSTSVIDFLVKYKNPVGENWAIYVQYRPAPNTGFFLSNAKFVRGKYYYALDGPYFTILNWDGIPIKMMIYNLDNGIPTFYVE